MRTKNKLAIALLCILCISLSLLIVGCSIQGKAVSTKEPIKIGFIGALTGDAATYGLEDQRALQLAVDEMNAAGGIKGQALQVIYEDGKCTGKEAANAAQKLINVDKVKIIMGGTCSGETLAIAPLAEAAKVLIFSSVSTNPDIKTAGDFIFRNAPSDAASASITAKLALRQGVKKVAAISENTDYAQAWKDVFKETFTANGGTIVIDEVYEPEATDFRTIITKVMKTKHDAVLISPQGASGGRVAKQLQELGHNIQLYGNAILSSAEIMNNYGKAIDGVYFSDAAGLSKQNVLAQSFLEKYEAKYGVKPNLDFYTGARYDSAFIIAQGLKKVGDDPEQLRDYLYSLPNYAGVIGTYHFDKDGEVVGVQFEDKQITNGEVIVLS